MLRDHLLGCPTEELRLSLEQAVREHVAELRDDRQVPLRALLCVEGSQQERRGERFRIGDLRVHVLTTTGCATRQTSTTRQR